MRKKSIILWVVILTQILVLNGQSSGEIYKDLVQLNQFGSVLYIAAHPDDENTRVISYLSKGLNYRVGYLSLTRGDGGQNLIGKEQGSILGVIRTQELLEARKIDGATQFFTSAYDFGYSKTPDETFKKWEGDRVLHDVVWVIRSFKPDVIISRFPTTGEGGHGHHTASAILAQEAFDAAADPSRFPEQLTKVSVWQAKRLLWNTFQFGDRNTTSPDQFQLNVGAYDPIAGVNFGEIAALSRSKHSSQGFGTPRNRLPIIEYFRTWKGHPPQLSLMDGVDTTWGKCIENSKLAQLIRLEIESLAANFDFTAPFKSIPKLVAIKKMIQETPAAFKSDNAFWTEQKVKELNQLISACAGIHAQFTVSKQFLVPGEEVRVKFSIVHRMPQNSPYTLSFSMLPNEVKKTLTNASWDTSFMLKIPSFTKQASSQLSATNSPPFVAEIFNDELVSHPYWLRESMDGALFAVQGYDLLGAAENPRVLYASFNIGFSNPSFSVFVEPTLQYYQIDPSIGEQFQPVYVVPPAVILIDNESYMLPTSSNEAKNDFFYAKFAVQAMRDNVRGKTVVQVPKGWQVELLKPHSLDFELAKQGEKHNVEIGIRIAGNAATKAAQLAGFKEQVKLHIIVDDQSFNRSMQVIRYPHIKDQVLLSDASFNVVGIPVQSELINGLGKIGYVTGSGDKVKESLILLGLNVEELNDEQLNNTVKLSAYETIIIGIRAFNVRQELNAIHQNLMQYVAEGGRLIVQYHTNNRFAPLSVDLGPYPIQISRDRVTDEEAAVTFVDSTHPLLHFPYTIKSRDFEGWVQERGVYFAGERDSSYRALLRMSDFNEEAVDGALVAVNYGQGVFIYTGLSFFRQLPAGVPGAYRLFLNLITPTPKPLSTENQSIKPCKKKKKK